MTDINKLIEEYTIDDFERMAMETDYAVEANEDTCKINEADAGAFYQEGMKRGIKLILHQNRWRKVEEELPEIGVKVLVKTTNENYSTSEMYLPKDCHGTILGGKEWKGSYSFKTSITQWKPIE